MVSHVRRSSSSYLSFLIFFSNWALIVDYGQYQLLGGGEMQDSSVGIVTGCGLDDWHSGFDSY